LFDAGLTPHVNQIQLHPYRLRPGLVALHRDRGVLTQSWSPLGLVPLPRSTHPGRQAENLASFDFTLTDDDMTTLGALDRPDLPLVDADRYGH